MGDVITWRYDPLSERWWYSQKCISVEEINHYPRERMQEIAIRHCGAPLPDRAFPPPEPEIVKLLAIYPGQTAAERMEAMVVDLLSTPRADT